MTNQEVYEALARGENRFVAKQSKRIYMVDPAQREMLKPFTDNNVLLIGFPEIVPPKMKMARYRGRKWVWLSPAGIERALSERSSK